MPPRQIADVLAELAECRQLVRSVKRHVHPDDRESLYKVDAHLGHITAALKISDEAWKDDQPALRLPDSADERGLAKPV